MIEFDHVTKAYGARTVVDDVSAKVPEGAVCMLIGPSGSGKTTLLRTVNRLVEPTSGRVLIGGQDVSRCDPEDLRRGLGYAIQSVGLFPHLTVRENIGTVPRLLHWDRRRIQRRGDELMRLVGLDPATYGDRHPRQLSGGEAQRVGVARALAADPPVLLMDEPFGAVDPLTRERLQEEFARIQRELRKTVLFVTHDIDEAIRLADYITIMRGGRLLQQDTPEAILERPADKFVHDFIGADRALKRLVRIRVGDVMRRDPPSVREGTPVDAARRAGGASRFVYTVDAGGGLTGWLDKRMLRDGDIEAVVTQVDAGTVAVTPDVSLKDALSRMLGLGFRSMPVVDEADRLVGEVGFESIESALSEDPS
ncbi:MAG: ABC transporter ATP-binding protein [Coriobacteriia bacterium]|nr:ABC transporter ATP-binding protein [Coriobacteriia bacterium]